MIKTEMPTYYYIPNTFLSQGHTNPSDRYIDMGHSILRRVLPEHDKIQGHTPRKRALDNWVGTDIVQPPRHAPHQGNNSA